MKEFESENNTKAVLNVVGSKKQRRSTELAEKNYTLISLAEHALALIFETHGLDKGWVSLDITDKNNGALSTIENTKEGGISNT